MSVTIFLEGAPKVKITPYPEEEPDYTEEVSAPGYPEMNLSNMNFAAMMQEVGLSVGQDLCGRWTVDELEKVHKAFMKALNSNKKKQAMEEQSYQQGNMLFCGRSAESVDSRLIGFVSLLEAAQRHKLNVCFC